VAVIAKNGMEGSIWRSLDKSRYARRKSWPHWDTQWTSSIAIQHIRDFLFISTNFEMFFVAYSGVIYNIRISLFSNLKTILYIYLEFKF